MENKKTISLVVIVVVLAAVLFVLLKWLPKKEEASAPVAPEAKTSVQPISKEDALAVFPADFPIEKQASNSTSPEVSYLDGKRTISYNYTSTKTFAQVFNSYDNYFKVNKLKYNLTQDTDKLKVISVMNPQSKAYILITINLNSISNKTEVSIVYSNGVYKVISN